MAFQKKRITGDKLGVYPQYMQVPAIPERRFLKTSRLLTVLTIVLLSINFFFISYIYFLSARIDISIFRNDVATLFYINHENMKLQQMDNENATVHSLQLLTEDMLIRYIKERNEIVWSNEEMDKRWQANGYVSLRTLDNRNLIPELRKELNNSRNEEFVRDVHIYTLKVAHPYTALWYAFIETFDMPVPDPFAPLCNSCQDNSKECIECKTKHAKARHRWELYIRPVFLKKPADQENPIGIGIRSYTALYVPENPVHPYWGLPSNIQKID